MAIKIWVDLLNLEYSYNFVGKTTSQLVTDWWTAQFWNAYAAFSSYWLYYNTSWSWSLIYSQPIEWNFSSVKKITLKLTARVYWNRTYDFRLVKSVSWSQMVNIKSLYTWYNGRWYSIKWTNLLSTTATTSQIEQRLTLDLENKTYTYSDDGWYSTSWTLTDAQIADIRNTWAFCVTAANNASSGTSSWLTSIYLKIES